MLQGQLLRRRLPSLVPLTLPILLLAQPWLLRLRATARRSQLLRLNRELLNRGSVQPGSVQPDSVQPGAAPADAAPAAPQPVIVAAGTKLTIKLGDDLGSKTSQTGQSFSATLDKDVVVDGQTEIPAGANVSGTVVIARPFGKYAGEANLTLKLTSVNINNSDQKIVTVPRSFGKPIQAKGKVKKFFGGLVKRAEGDEKEVTLAADSTYTFALKKPLTIQ